MAENTSISWADATFNPWVGCTKVSPACDGCYAEHLMQNRMGRVVWGAPGLGEGTRERTSAAAPFTLVFSRVGDTPASHSPRSQPRTNGEAPGPMWGLCGKQFAGRSRHPPSQRGVSGGLLGSRRALMPPLGRTISSPTPSFRPAYVR